MRPRNGRERKFDRKNQAALVILLTPFRVVSRLGFSHVLRIDDNSINFACYIVYGDDCVYEVAVG